MAQDGVKPEMLAWVGRVHAIAPPLRAGRRSDARLQRAVADDDELDTG